MAKPGANPVERQSVDLVRENIARLKELFPEAVSEGKVDFEKLKATLGEIVEDKPERYSFTWAGKRDAIRLLQVPSRATLKPCPQESVNWATTKNLFIEGENLEVLKLLYKSYAGRVKMIYIDPPYNTGNDFIYPDDFTDPLCAYLKLTGHMGEDGQRTDPDDFMGALRNTVNSARYHSAWLSMMYPRLFVARQMLSEDGLIFVSIDDHELHNLRSIMNEVFGEEGFVAQLIWKARQFPDSRALTHVSTDHEYILVYSRGEGAFLRGVERDESKFDNPDNDPRGPWMSRSMLGLATKEQRPNLHYEVTDPNTGRKFSPPASTGWRYSHQRMQELIDAGCILFPAESTGRPREKKFRKDLADDFSSFPSIVDDIHTAQGTAEIRELFGFQAFDFPKPSDLVKRLIKQSTKDGDIILDFFAGSGTTAQAVLSHNRENGSSCQFICVQLPEATGDDSEVHRRGFPTITALAEERVRRVIRTMMKQVKGELGFRNGNSQEDMGFRVFRLTESNYRQWHGLNETDGQKYADEMALFTESLLPGWKTDDVTWEVILKEGYRLSSTVEPLQEIKSNQVLRVTDPDREQSFCMMRQPKQ
jgi:adenine-specific DNA-methyltransferase